MPRSSNRTYGFRWHSIQAPRNHGPSSDARREVRPDRPPANTRPVLNDQHVRDDRPPCLVRNPLIGHVSHSRRRGFSRPIWRPWTYATTPATRTSKAYPVTEVEREAPHAIRSLVGSVLVHPLQLVEPLDCTLVKNHLRHVVLEELVDCRVLDMGTSTDDATAIVNDLASYTECESVRNRHPRHR
jgi:hypothetical protein